MMVAFNLVDQPWIPVSTGEGRSESVSLVELFEHAPRIRSIDTGNPLTTAALHRLALAVLHASLEGPRSPAAWREIWDAGSFSGTRVRRYLEERRHRFDLFSEIAPFYQVPAYEVESPARILRLSVELATGNNKTLFDHRTDDSIEPFAPDRAALALVTAQAFSLCGGKTPASNLFREHPNLTHAPLIGGAVVLLEGASLFETLSLNLLVLREDRPVVSTQRDMPIWDRTEFSEPGDRVPDGYLDYLTWMSRHIRLIPEVGPGGPIVRHMHFGQGYHVPTGLVDDPMFAYRIREGDKRPIRVSVDRALWRDSDTLFRLREDVSILAPQTVWQAAEFTDRGWLGRELALSCRLLGLAIDKANPLLWRDESLPVSTELLANESLALGVQEAVVAADTAGGMLRRAAEVLAAGVLPASAPKSAVSTMIASLHTMEIYWTSLELPFRDFLRSLPGDAGAARDGWIRTVRSRAFVALHSTADNCAGRGAKELRARVESERRLAALLSTLNPEEELV